MGKDKQVLIRRTLYTANTLHIRESDGENSRKITGYAILFNTPSSTLYEDSEEVIREVISPSAVTQELLDQSDIKMTLFHDRHLILARSKSGAGSLTYHIDNKGVSFEFDAPHTADGDKAVELVKRGDIDGCSFMFTTRYYDEDYVSRTVSARDGKYEKIFTVNKITGIYDFTLTPDPAYPDTSCQARELIDALREKKEMPNDIVCRQVEEMRRNAHLRIN